MRVLRCIIENFRGYDRLELLPRGHVLLVGEPRSGRSDLLAALGKVFEIDQTRLDELDFHCRDLIRDIEIEVLVGDLEPSTQQRFLDQLEFWDTDSTALIDDIDDPGALPAVA